MLRQQTDLQIKVRALSVAADIRFCAMSTKVEIKLPSMAAIIARVTKDSSRELHNAWLRKRSIAGRCAAV